MTVTQQVEQSISFEGFVTAALPGLVRFAQWVTGPGGDAEDLVHDALIRVGARWGSISLRPGDPSAYVRRAIVNGHVSRWRSRRRERLVDLAPEPPAGAGPAADIRHGGLWRAVEALPRGQRAVIALRFFEDLTLARTAEVLGVTENTVRTQQQRALQALRRQLTDEREDLDGALVLLATDARTVPLPVPAVGAGARLAQEVESRRRARLAVAAGAAAAAVAALVTAGVWLQGRQFDVVQPVTPPPSTSSQRPTPAPLTPTPSPTLSRAVLESTPAATTRGQVPTASPVSTPNESTPAGDATPAVALDLDSYAFGAVRDLADVPGNLTRVDDLAAPWPINPCPPRTAYPTDRARLDFAKESTAQDTAFVAALATYPDAATASEVLAGFSRAVAACGGVGEPPPAADSGSVQWGTFDAGGLGDESLGFLSTTFESAEIQPGDSFVAMRVGTAVLVVEVYRSRGVASVETDSRSRQVTEFAGQELANLQSALERG